MNELTQRLRTFLKVAEHQSFNVAARELDIASSTATRHVNHLERQLGEPLLVRTTRHVRLSPAGERALIRFRAILAEVDQLEGELESLSERVAGPLRISVPWRYSRLYLAPLVSEFMQCYPEVALDIVSSDQRVDLVEDHFDVALRIGHLEDSSLIARHISDQRFVLAAAPSYLAAQPPIHQPQDLEQHRLLTFSYTTANHHWRLVQGDRKHRISVRARALRTNNADILTQAALGGTGVVVQPLWAIREELASGRLLPVLEDFQVTSSDFDTGIHVVFARENQHNPRVRAWVDFLLARRERLSCC